MSDEQILTDDIPTDAVLVGIEGSELDETCIAWAAAAAERVGRPLHLVHAREDLGLSAVDPIMGGWAVLTVDIPADDGFLEEELARARRQWPELAITGSSPPGRHEHVLVEFSDRAYMIVTGAPKRRGLDRILGRPSLAAAMHSACPVVIVPQGVRPEPDGPVIAAVDGSEPSRFALRRAFVVARTRGDRLIVVTTWGVQVLGGLVVTEAGGASWESVENDYRAMVQEMVDEFTSEFPSVDVQIRVLHGRPAQVITGLSGEAGLLVLGSRGRGGFRGMLLGSVTHEVIETATCPVLVARKANRD